MANQNQNKITKYRRPLNINIGMVIFAVIFVYIVFCVFTYFTSRHVVWYEVQAGSLSTNNIYEGIAIRDETVVNATDAGYINYFASAKNLCYKPLDCDRDKNKKILS